MFEFSINDNKYLKVHFIGIGGISMSGIAEILIGEGYQVSGSDTKDSAIISKLKNIGAKIYIDHKKCNINNPDLVIYTDAISKENEELEKSLSLGIPVVDRASFLGALMKNYKNSIAVSGTHGKTSTTSMLSTILNRSNLNPTILLGGELDEIGGNVRLGSKDLMLTEACEYKGNILKYFPSMAIILNIDEDHLDYFSGLEHIQDTFIQYGKNLDKNSDLIINADDPNAQMVINGTVSNVITFGIESKSDYVAENITFSEEGFPSYTLNFKNKYFYPITLSVMGIHNIYNSMASIIAAKTIGLNMDFIINNISQYTGVHRRLEFKGFYNGVKVIDDYAHHPTEIKATLNALKTSKTGKIYCVFQPHTFTRTKLLLKGFSESFSDADKIIITDIYASREKDNGMVHSTDLSNALKEKGLDVVYIETFEQIKSYIIENAKENDIVITMGAGNIYIVGEEILSSFKQNILEDKKEKAAV